MKNLNTIQEIGTLFIVATPIGNMSDITLRALETLKKVNFILAEDTRKSGLLLKHFGIEKQLISYRDQNHERIFPKILNLILSGASLALITDSGTPNISDPGYKLVRDLIENGIPIVAIPGPNAGIAALSASGLPTDKFTFLGFLPKGNLARLKILKEYGQSESTLVIYESPFRIIKLLGQIKEALGDRAVCITNELTKKFEKTFRGKVTKLIQQLEGISLKGEFVVLIAKKGFALTHPETTSKSNHIGQF